MKNNKLRAITCGMVRSKRVDHLFVNNDCMAYVCSILIVLNWVVFMMLLSEESRPVLTRGYRGGVSVNSIYLNKLFIINFL
jgi:hypothetical protein